MPRIVRNFWIKASIDGRSTKLAGGPRSKHGGMRLEILMRDEGEVSKKVEIWGLANRNGNLTLEIRVPDNVKLIPDMTETGKRILIRTAR